MIVTPSATPNILALPFAVTLPIPFGVKVKPIFVSPPVAEIVGLADAAALAIVISFVADAVVENLICSLEFSSIIPYVLAT